MKRALTFLFAVVGCWTVSFVQAANVELKFYSGVPGEYVSVAEDLNCAVVGVDGNSLVKETLDAENKGKIGADIEADEFYVIAEQPSTKFFGSVLVNKDADDSELFFILDASGLTWLKDAHSCPDDAECMKDGAEGNCDCCDDAFVGKQHNGEEYEKGQCCDDDCCDADCICRKLADYLAKDVENVDGAEAPVQDGNAANGKNASTNGQNALQNGQTAARNGQYPSRTSTSSNTVSRSPYSSGNSNFGTTGTGASPYGGIGGAGAGAAGAAGAAGSMGALGMLGVVGAMIATTVAVTSKDPVSKSSTSTETE